MDLMIDCMPLYEMIEDDMKNIANLNNSTNLSINSNSASPSCLSDEEQLALTSCSIFDDLFFFTQPNQINSTTNNFEQMTPVKIESDYNQRPNSNINCTLSLNESFNSSSSSSSSSSSAVCSPLSSPLSLSMSSSSLCAALANTTFSTSINNSPSQQHQQNWDISQIMVEQNQFGTTNTNSNNYQSDRMTGEEEVSVSPVNTASVMQDSYLNNNFNLYHVINPMDLNRNYTSNNINLLQSQIETKNSLNILNENNKQTNLSTSNYSHQQIKRSKFSHTNNSSLNNSSNTQMKQEPVFNSDGESTGSNESNDSNSSFGSSCHNNGVEYSKQLVKIEPFQLKNLTNSNDLDQQQQQQPQILNVNNSTQINLIKINNNPKENKNSTTTLNNLISNSNSLKLPVTTSKITSNPSDMNQNHKTIIQYKQLLTTNLNSSVKLQQQQQPLANTNINNNNSTCTNLQLTNNSLITSSRNDVIKVYPKPPYSYSCLIAMALRNSDTGNLPVSDIYDFIIENFPYYKTARDGWKNSIRHNLSLNKCFEKIENPTNGSKKGCLWALNPDKCKKLEEECKRCRQRDPINIRLSMSRPDDLNKIERGEQRLKKYPIQNQRKTIDSNNTNTTSSSSTSLSNAISLNQTNDQLINNDSFLLEWANNKNSTFILKEEDDTDHYFDDSDIKFDSILLSTISPTTIRNIV